MTMKADPSAVKINRFPDIIKALRLEKGLTLERAAKALGTHKGYISSWENGTVMPPSIKFMAKISKLYGVSVEDLAELAWAEKAPEVVRARIFDRIAKGDGTNSVVNALAMADIKSVGASTVVVL